ncbi:hypothetical protein EJB05_02695, partial [Eragrostis curvula]
MANPRGAAPLLRPRLRRLLRSPMSSCACLLLAFSALLLLSSLRQVAQVDFPRPDLPGQICDMVAVARLVNATLVIPQLDKRSFWQDTSKFKDIFDEPHFIKALEGDVHIVTDLPESLQSAPRARKHFTSWSSASYYEEVKELWKDHKVVHIPKSDSRLANNGLPIDIQRLRCRCLYQALRFSDLIEDLGKA